MQGRVLEEIGIRIGFAKAQPLTGEDLRLQAELEEHEREMGTYVSPEQAARMVAEVVDPQHHMDAASVPSSPTASVATSRGLSASATFQNVMAKPIAASFAVPASSAKPATTPTPTPSESGPVTFVYTIPHLPHLKGDNEDDGTYHPVNVPFLKDVRRRLEFGNASLSEIETWHTQMCPHIVELSTDSVGRNYHFDCYVFKEYQLLNLFSR
jgi:hypothetical protein